MPFCWKLYKDLYGQIPGRGCQESWCTGEKCEPGDQKVTKQFEPCHEKTNNLHRQNQRRSSASR